MMATIINLHGIHNQTQWDSQSNTINTRQLKTLSTQVHSLHWNQVRRDCFLSGAWDDTCKLWSLNAPSSMRTFAEHRYCVYTVVWCVDRVDSVDRVVSHTAI